MDIPNYLCIWNNTYFLKIYSCRYLHFGILSMMMMMMIVGIFTCLLAISQLSQHNFWYLLYSVGSNLCA